MYYKWLCAFFGVFLFVLASPSSRAAAAQTPVYILARAPQLAPVTLRKAWQPLLDRIAADTGIRIELKVYPSRPKFEADLLSGTPDFAFMNPFYAVLAKKRHGYIPLVRDDSRSLTGILVVRKDSPITSVQALDGATIVFPDPNAMGASLYPRARLVEKAKIHFNAQYVGTHENVYRAVSLGEFVAGGGVNTTLSREPAGLRAQLRVLYETPGVPPHPLIAHPRVPAPVREAVVEEILRLAQDAEGQKLLEAVKLSDPVRADFARDYRELERLGLGKYMVPPLDD